MQLTIVHWRFAAHGTERSSFSAGLARLFRDDDNVGGAFEAVTLRLRGTVFFFAFPVGVVRFHSSRTTP